MGGYANNITRVLHEWYQLFKQKNYIFSDIENKRWEYIIKNKLLNLKNDCWKHISFKEFLEHNFICAKNMKFNILQHTTLSLPIDAYQLVFFNGKFLDKFSDTNINPWTLNIDYDFNRHAAFYSIQSTIFPYLTECLSDEMVHINLPEQIITKKPLYLLYISEGSDIKNQLVTSHYSHQITIGNNSEAYIIEHFVSMNATTKNFNGIRTFISAGEKSKLDHIQLIFENRNSYHISSHNINIGRLSHVNSSTFTILGPKLILNHTDSKLNHADSSISLNSLTFLSEKDIGSIHTNVEHNNPDHADSRQKHKIIARDYSIGIFNGLIKVNKDSIKTNGQMINNNLLLDQTATIYSIPKLEIYSDAVQCNHGATVGKIDSNLIFYLNTRGFTEQDALKMLTYAFSVDIIKKINHSLLEDIISKRVDKALIRDAL